MKNLLFGIAIIVTYGTCPLLVPRVAAEESLVEMIVRGPNGRPLAKTEVTVTTGEDLRGDPAPRLHFATDSQGVARFAWPVGVGRVRVEVDKVGYGMTGWFETIGWKTARPALPPLIPCGVVEGNIPPESREPGVYVTARCQVDWTERDRDIEAACDAQGHFAIENVRCGYCSLALHNEKGRLPYSAGAFIAPGQRLTGLTFHKDDQPKNNVVNGSLNHPGRSDKPIVWAAGTVRDELDHPIANATVFAHVGYHGGLRMYELVESAKTDVQGQWTIRGQARLPMFEGTLIAHKTGRPYVALPMHDPQAAEEPGGKATRPPSYDIVLPSRGGNLVVTVSRDGKPAGNAGVLLTNYHGPQLDSPCYVGAAHGDKSEELRAIIAPFAETDRFGRAHFTGLAPDEYKVAALDERAVELVRGAVDEEDKSRSRRAICEGIAVRAGETQELKVALYWEPMFVPFQVLQPDCKPCARCSFGLDCRRVARGGWSSGTDVDANGRGRLYLSDRFGESQTDSLGLWQATLKYRDTPVRWVPIGDAPYYEAQAVLAVSPLVGADKTAVLTAVRNEPGSVVVQLQDAHGGPMPGYVLANSAFFYRNGFCGSTDKNGELRLEGIQAWKHELEAYAASSTLPELGADGDPIPNDERLLQHSLFFPQHVETHLNGETRVVFRAQPVGYVRGTIHAPAGRKSVDARMDCTHDDIRSFTVRFDKQTGQFLAGPFLEGKRTLYVSYITKDPDLAVATQEVTISSERVAHLDLYSKVKKQEKVRSRPGPWLLVGAGGAEMWDDLARVLRGKVLMADGRTPAGGACLAVFLPAAWPPIGGGTTDATGRIVGKTGWHSVNQEEHTRPGSPRVPVVVAWIPGTCGATITELTAHNIEKELKIVLPPPQRLLGKVTVGGKPVRGRSNRFCVLALHEGKGKLDGLLSRQVSADLDGMFEIPALTPGSYRIQAAMDDIWLSPSARVAIASKMEPRSPMTLDIGIPGTTSVIRVTDKQGKPRPRVQAVVIRPQGPLAVLFWPAHFTSDGAGAILIPPLEAGAHTVRIQGMSKDCTLLIPPLSDSTAKPPIITSVLD
jgi:hypothetical protein